MSACESIRESIGTWLDGELYGADAEAVGAHLQTCPICGEERRQLEKLNMALKKALEAESLPVHAQSFWRDLRRRIEAKRAWSAEVKAWLGSTVRAPSFAWGVPVAIALLIGAVYSDAILSGWGLGSPRNNFASVESIDAFGRNVALLREYETRTTVIWLYQNTDSDSEAAGETSDKSPAF